MLRGGLLAVALIAIAPLPVHASDCGASMLTGTLVVERTGEDASDPDREQPRGAPTACTIAATGPAAVTG